MVLIDPIMEECVIVISFVYYSRGNKERRFPLRTKEECRIHHDALADVNWKCSNLPYDRITCNDDEERASRRVYRGYTRFPTLQGLYFLCVLWV